ncbi:hypothetical protein K437DRAFT_231668 [Tilletiaria anomala UBC 951]|uniref:Glutamine amidotransferase domain-containing protein n=1 Tax=Tilletiaria anomala (strain ATCC 24038 / CBS 436.72 / UBC 951) TaxID=1037660 RepID=A0A066WGI2_TILAU|nr:uncharacterized protein K437DRAFT_231668 [Tilletiaria anomala UBC 951]KDN52871.1 hypothetical protein K437DRAFT_231668 [Tilletiaria anomala UBC 951]
MLYILDYGAGNVRSLANSIKKLGYDFKWVASPADLEKADALLFPGVGSYWGALHSLRTKGYVEPLKAYIASGKPYMGICIGMQALFDASDEGTETVPGLGIVPGRVSRFSEVDASGRKKSVPQMGWNEARALEREQIGFAEAERYGLSSSSSSSSSSTTQHFYFVHSYRAAYDPKLHAEWALTLTQYGEEVFISSISRGNVFGTQFHPEKSGRAGLELLRAWLHRSCDQSNLAASPSSSAAASTSATPRESSKVKDAEAAGKPRGGKDGLTKRVVACLDVRSNDAGDLVVTKGESYDVREKADEHEQAGADGKGAIRNLGKPVDLAHRYYLEGADEIVFLNITSFRSSPLKDQPMLDVLRLAAAECFVPLTIGGGIKDFVEPDSGVTKSAKEVADEYFRAGADKVSIGSEAVLAVEEMLARQGSGVTDPALVDDSALTGKTGIEMISKAYGAQAVVVSIDPRRVYLQPSDAVPPAHAACVVTGEPGSEDAGKRWWYRCTIKGGREDRDIDVVQLARGVQRLGAGEVLLNSIDRDGSNKGFDRQLVDLVRRSVSIPIVASSGAGVPKHFEDIFVPQPLRTGEAPSSVEAALAAGIFHRQECTIGEVKQHLLATSFNVRSENVQEGASES